MSSPPQGHSILEPPRGDQRSTRVTAGGSGQNADFSVLRVKAISRRQLVHRGPRQRSGDGATERTAGTAVDLSLSEAPWPRDQGQGGLTSFGASGRLPPTRLGRVLSLGAEVLGRGAAQPQHPPCGGTAPGEASQHYSGTTACGQPPVDAWACPVQPHRRHRKWVGALRGGWGGADEPGHQ